MLCLDYRPVGATRLTFWGCSMFHLSAQNISRASGHSAVKASAYRSTSRMEDRRLGEQHDFTRKDRAVHSEIVVPAGAPSWASNREELWNQIEAVEDRSTRRKTATLAKEMNLALPNRIDRDRQIEMVRSFVKENFTDKGLVAQVDFHRGHKADRFQNNHVHIMVTTRPLVGQEFGKKDRALDKKATLYQWRNSWERSVNLEFERANLMDRVSAKSYRARGIDRVPTIHIGRGPGAEERRKQNERIRVLNSEKSLWQTERLAHETQLFLVRYDQDTERRQKAQEVSPPPPRPRIEEVAKPEPSKIAQAMAELGQKKRTEELHQAQEKTAKPELPKGPVLRSTELPENAKRWLDELEIGTNTKKAQKEAWAETKDKLFARSAYDKRFHQLLEEGKAAAERNEARLKGLKDGPLRRALKDGVDWANAGHDRRMIFSAAAERYAAEIGQINDLARAQWAKDHPAPKIERSRRQGVDRGPGPEKARDRDDFDLGM